ncbi:MAG: glycosyltransferase, partial [Candidatus Weimeria sp.]
YTDGEDIILFDLDEKSIGELPVRLKALLSDKDRLLHIAWNGYKKALKNHTWDARVEQFLKMTV